MQVIKITDNPSTQPTSKYPHASWDFTEFNPVQTRLLETYDGTSNIAIAAATSAGKAQPLSAKLLTPSGFEKMGDIKVGDEVIGSNGEPTVVTGVFPQGNKMVYRVTFSDGATTTCCDDHLWTVRTKYDKYKCRPWRTKSLKELLGDLKTRDGQNKWFIPLLDVANSAMRTLQRFEWSHLPLHPYLLGLLLGDGGIQHRVILSSADKELVERAQWLLPEGVLMDYLEKYDYQITGGMSEDVPGSGLKRTNLVKKGLIELGLFGLGSCDKFIPQSYLNAGPRVRFALLSGLMDTDGSANGDKAAEFTSCSFKLASGVCQLARSLGASTRVRTGDSGYVNKEGLYVECEPRYRVTVNIGSLNPFSLPRKANSQRVGLNKGRNRSISRVDLIGEEECQCIAVDAADHLYATDDYILTHNTVCSEMYLAYEIAKRHGKGIYVGPLKALCKEKEMDWSADTHHFHKVNTFIATGDYRFTAKRIEEMDNSDLVVMTPEMLASRCRNHKSDKSKFLYEVGTVVFDESHLLTVPSRGDHIEVALMKLTDINPDIRIVLLSATMPNVDEICGWVSKLTGRDTYYLESDYRPCPLSIHYETYYDGDRLYDDKELAKIGTACAIVEYYPDDKFLVFTHTKRTGHKMVESLERYGIKAEFHNADLGLKDRLKLEERFKKDKSFRVLVATSTLAWGLNLPARRVIVTGIHRGLQEVENYDIQQMIGRAGRPRYDPRGDAYILVPESEKDITINKLKHKPPIRSTLLDFVGKAENPHYKTLAFHVVAEIHQGGVKTKEGFHDWFKRSLAHYQDQAFDDTVMDRTLSLLEQYKAIFTDEEGLYQCTAIGKIASMFYYSPFDVSDLKRNFKILFDEKRDHDDHTISISLGNVDTHRWGIVNKWEREAIAQYQGKIEKMFGKDKFTASAIKIGCVYYNMLKGNFSNFKMSRELQVLQAVQGSLLVDLDRTMQVLNAIDGMSAKWDKTGWFRLLGMRVRYGVEADLVELCQIPNVGVARAKKLKAKRIKTVDDFACYDAKTLAAVMGCGLKVAEEALAGAKDIQLKESIS